MLIQTFLPVISVQVQEKSDLCSVNIKRLKDVYEGVLTGKGLTWGGSLARTQATGYGLVYYAQEMLKDLGTDFNGKTVAISGAGNVAIYACERHSSLVQRLSLFLTQTVTLLMKKVSTLQQLRKSKEVKRGRIKDYLNYRPNAKYVEGAGLWQAVKVDVALPCATQNELLIDDAKALVANGTMIVAEGANMPTTLEATQYLQENGVYFAPGKASNAGGVCYFSS